MAQLVPFDELGGLDLVSHDRIASPMRCRSCKNVQKRRSRSLARRQGNKATATNTGNNGGFGTAIYNRRSTTTGVVTKEKLVMGAKLWKQTNYTLTITYSGGGAAIGEVLVDTATNTWHLRLYDSGNLALDYDMGVGFDEASPKTVTQLITAINAVASFAASTTGGGSLPAAFLPYTVASPIATTLDISFCETVAVNQPTGAANPFAGAFANRNGTEFENVATVQIDDIILFFSKWDTQKKYDGCDCYRSGAQQGNIVSTAEAGAGAFTNGTYQYMTTVVQIDQQNNEVEGIESATKSLVIAANHPGLITLTNVLAASGFNTDCAIVNGAQATVNTITVDNGVGPNGHTMKVGQKAYFFDAVSAGYVTRNITAIAAGTITVDGAAVTVADNAVISNNLRLRLYRSVAAGTILKENVDIPNNSFTATQVYSDNKADASLGADYVSPSLDGVEHGLPPTGGYGGTFDGGVVTAGFLDDPDAFAWTSPDGPEYYPEKFRDRNQSGDNLPITGLSSGDRYFWTQKRETSFLVTGKLTTGQYTSVRKGDSAGCLAHATMIQADTSLFWLGEGGVYESRDGGTPSLISDDIAPVFDNAGLSADRKLQFKRATAVYDKHTKFYVLFIPAETSQGGEVYANASSRIFAFDTVNREWWEWDNLNWAGGVVHDEQTGDMIWCERRYSTFSSTMAFQMYQRLNTNTPADYVDHVTDIAWSYEPAGVIDAGQADVNKKFLYMLIDAEDPEKTPNYTLTVRVEKDNVKGIYQSVLTVPIGSATTASDGWGYGAWGFFPWGNPIGAANKRRRLKHGFSECIRPLFSGSGIYNEIVLSSFSLLIEAPYKIDINEARRGG